MADPAAPLKEMTPEKEFFIGFDSDGCVFDSMEIKQKECFCPNFINVFEMQGASTITRETWEFVNLYSKTRGCNRFLAVLRTLELLPHRKEIRARGIQVKSLPGLRAWTERESKLGQATLIPEVEKTHDPDLEIALRWSQDVTAAVAKIVRNLPPFPQVPEVLKKASPRADLIVVSQTPVGDLIREWEEHGIDAWVRFIAGQEMGTKAQHIEFAASGRYPKEKILMIGDAPGDLKAAEHNEALFYPIIPGREEACWERFRDEALDRFFAGTYAGGYHESLLDEFDKALPAQPPWETV